MYGSRRDDVGLVNCLQVLFEREIEVVGCLKMGVGLAQKCDVLVEFLVCLH